MSLITIINNKIPRRFKRIYGTIIREAEEFFYDTNFLYGGDIISRYTTKKRFRKYNVSNRNCQPSVNPTPMIIYMADGKSRSNGLTDRFRSIVSLYLLSQKLDIGFKVNFTSPVDLRNYLIPNEYDWVINDNDIVYDAKRSVVCSFHNCSVSENSIFERMRKFAEKYSQIHVPICLRILSPAEYATTFNKLFKPTQELQTLINSHLTKIGRDFISVTFRFQQLLGDFVEGDYPVLPFAERDDLMERCVEHLTEIYKENGDAKKVLVTSDSVTFLNKVKNIDFVYVIPGKIAHIEYEQGLDHNVYMKSFLDYFLLTHSKQVYSVVDGAMYPSGFPLTAAFHTGKTIIVKRY